jgi:hypothetical protein
MYQKTFAIFNNVTKSNYSELTQKFIDFIHNRHPEQDVVSIEVDEFLNQQKRIVDKIGKEGLLKRIDIYSFGMMILFSIHNLIKNMKNKENADVTNTIFQYYLFGLYRLAFYCCYQTENTPDIDYIVDYMDTLNNLYQCNTLLKTDSKRDELDIVEKCANNLYKFPDINFVSHTKFLELEKIQETKVPLKKQTTYKSRRNVDMPTKTMRRNKSRSRSRERENTDLNKMLVTP